VDEPPFRWYVCIIFLVLLWTCPRELVQSYSSGLLSWGGDLGVVQSFFSSGSIVIASFEMSPITSSSLIVVYELQYSERIS
jgi:hypothetical protein